MKKDYKITKLNTLAVSYTHLDVYKRQIITRPQVITRNFVKAIEAR